MFQAYQTKMKNMNIPTSNGMIIDTYEYFEETASYFGSIERKLFVDLHVRNKDANPTKVLYCAKYNLTARQYNSIKNQLDGRVKACKESRTFHINEMIEKIKKLEHTISKKIESKEKANLKEMSKKQARMLSGLGYSSYKELLESKCKKAGIETIPVSPAYTSQIGHAKFMKRYGLGSHNSAALVIARRGLGCSIEKVPYECPIGYPKTFTRSKTRKQQWASLTKFWKKHTFQQKLYVLNKLG